MDKYIYTPYTIPHYQGVVDLEKVFELISLHGGVICTQGMDFTYKILVGANETKVIFSIRKTEIRK